MEPARECCILQSQTEVIVSPKYRVLSSSSHSVVSDSTRREFAGADIANAETRTDTSADKIHNLSEVALSPVNRLIAGFTQFLFGSETDARTGSIAESLTYKSEVWNIKTKLFCRVIALEDFSVVRLKNNFTTGTQRMLDADEHCSSELASDETLSCSDLLVDSVDLLQQPTSVYVSIYTILSQLPAVSLDSVPVTFLATLSRLRSPSEQLAVNRIQHAKSAYSGSEDVKENDSRMNERKIVVRVIVTNFNNESCASGFRFMQPVPQKHILVSSLLRRQMNMSLTGKVALTPLCIPSDTFPTKMNVYLLCSVVSCSFNLQVTILIIKHLLNVDLSSKFLSVAYETFLEQKIH